MKTYISPLGFETTHIISLIVAHGIEKGDRIIILRPIVPDPRADHALDDIKDLTGKVDHTITVDVVTIDHHDFSAMVLSLMDLIASAAQPATTPPTTQPAAPSPPVPPTPARGKVIINLSGGPREILIALTAASITLSELVYKTTNFSDIDRELREIKLPHIVRTPDVKVRQILGDILENGPTTLTAIASRLGISESTISRSCAKLADMQAVEITPDGRNKQITLTLSGKVLLKVGGI
ncbi:MAG: winged helix-turn-helix transcriptional regulator [Methanosarcinales archaeon]|nr:winged helix-turn-helix transcriptional regulator [Methanosarcinales archaeon]